MNTPGYWRYETTGALRPVIVAYLHGKPLDPEQAAILRAYLRQWIMAPVWDQNPHAGIAQRAALADLRDRIDELTDRAAIDRWLSDALDTGIDPL